VALATLVLSLHCGQEPGKASDADKGPNESPDQEGWNSSVTSSNNGRVEAVVDYGHMARFINRGRIYFDEGVGVDFFDNHGRRRSRLTSEKGELVESTNDIFATGHVKVVSDTGITVLTEKLAYNQKSGKISSDLDVTLITNQGDTLHGTGFESDAQLHVWQIKKLHGTSHKHLDLSGDQFRKPRPPADSLSRKE